MNTRSSRGPGEGTVLLLYQRWGLRLICSFHCGLLCSQTLGACRRMKPGVLAAIRHPGRCPGFEVPKSWWQSNPQLEENKAASPLRFLEKWSQVCACRWRVRLFLSSGRTLRFSISPKNSRETKFLHKTSPYDIILDGNCDGWLRGRQKSNKTA